VQRISAIPDDLKELYKTVWEIKQRTILDQAADRGAFICQSQSLNIHIAEPSNSKLTSMHFYAWKLGLKTGMYYLRTKPKADAIQFTVDQLALAEARNSTGITSGFMAPSKPAILAAVLGEDQAEGAADAAATEAGGAAAAARASPLSFGESGLDSPAPKVGASPEPKAAPAAGAAIPAGGSPGDAAPAVVEEVSIMPARGGAGEAGPSTFTADAGGVKKSLADRMREAAEERARLRANLNAYDAGEEVCLSCGS
jgi:ribonucleotide reductase alpha subunit